MKYETKYGPLITIKEEGSVYKEWNGQKKKITKFLTLCHCGIKFIGRLTDIKRGRLQSCGCSSKKRQEFFKSSRYKHGLSHSKIERVFQGIQGRCNNTKHKSYHNYGGRGIKCEWKTFEDFYNDIGITYKEGLSIDRIDVNGDYNKNNCRWVDIKTQANNTRRNVYITVNGITKTMTQWCEELNIGYSMVRKRIQKGRDKKEALLTPKQRKNV